jgi:putative flippase GtrA
MSGAGPVRTVTLEGLTFFIFLSVLVGAAVSAPLTSPDERRDGAVDGRGSKFRSEVVQFLVAGGLAYAVDVLVFNLMLMAVSDGVVAKIVSSVPATIVAYIGNRYWTYKDRERSGVGREYTMFFVLSAFAAGIQAGTVWVSNAFGFHSVLADNIAGNVIGMALGTIFRFWAFRTFVFKHAGEPVAAGAAR